MPQDGRPESEGSEGEVKVVDRRRFRPDGDPVDRAPEGSSPEPAPAEAGASAPAEPPDPRDAQLAAQAARIDELSRAYAALVEDNKAFRTRLEREKERSLEAERVSLVQALLEATDDLERALAAVTGAGDAQGEALRLLIEGVRLTLSALQQRIQGLGAERISVVGERFDPRVAEAVDAVPVSDAGQDELVIEEVRSGYRIGDRILRPARVRVGRLARA